MTAVATEPESAIVLTNCIGVGLLLVCYMFGVWVRTYVLSTDLQSSLWRELVLALPIGLFVVAGYAKTTIPTILADQSGSLVEDSILAVSYATIFGMLSRETLGTLLAAFGRSMPGVGSRGSSPIAP